MNFLETIIASKKEEVASRKRHTLRSKLEDMPKYDYPRLSLGRALAEKEVAIIAEIKKASPSKKVLREDFDPLEIARQFVRGGASALSVLTDERFFQGRLEFIESMRHLVNVPVLRKDFIIDPYQLYESRACGADAVLLIAAALEPGRLHDLVDEAGSLGMECLVEVHDEEEIDALDFSKIGLVGLNNRDLETFETDIWTSVRLSKYIGPGTIRVSESGISTSRDLDLLISHDIHAFLIGEYFMRAEDPGKALHELVDGVGRAG